MQLDKLIQGQVYFNAQSGQHMMYLQTVLERGEERFAFTLPIRTKNRYVYLSKMDVLKYIQKDEQSKVRKP